MQAHRYVYEQVLQSLLAVREPGILTADTIRRTFHRLASTNTKVAKSEEQMRTEEISARELAFELVRRFAPDELPLFDANWEDLAASPPADVLSSRRHGAGGELLPQFLSVVLIALAQAVMQKSVDISVDAIRDWLRRNRKSDGGDQQDREISETAVSLMRGAPDGQSTRPSGTANQT